MSEIIIQSKAVALTIIVALVAVVAAGIIGYNLGMANGLKNKEQINYLVAPNTDTYTYTPPVTNNQPTNTNTPVVSPPPAEIPLSGEPISVEGKTIITGEISAMSTAGFTLSVTSQIVNTATREVTEKTANYKIKITSDTKVTEYISTIIIPEGAGTPQVTQSTKKLSVSELKNGQSVTVVSNDDINSGVLNALEVRVSTMVRK